MRKPGRITFWGIIFSVMFLMAATTAQADIFIPGMRGAAGDTITFSVEVPDAPNAVKSFGLKVAYDTSSLTYTGKDFTGSLVENFAFTNANETGGVVTVGGFDTTGFAAGSSGYLVKLTFTVDDPSFDSTLILQELVDNIITWTPGNPTEPINYGVDNGTFGIKCDPAGSTTSCSTGQPGVCAEGTKICDGNGDWGSCEPNVPQSDETCDNLDNDCDGSTDEDFTTLDQACDGTDSDDCEDGIFICKADHSDVECDDATDENAEVCDGIDNDCDGSTDEDFATLGQACDGTDSDDCEDGIFICKADHSDVMCDDATDNSQEVCDGIDNNCDGQTDEGFIGLGDPCDGLDSDLCEEGKIVCKGDKTGVECSDTTDNTLDVCDGNDNDCNPATDDGVDDVELGIACDGADDDLCKEGVKECVAGSLACSDDTPTNIEECNGLDDDCDGTVPSNEVDNDRDGVLECNGDCDGENAAVYTGADEVCDGIDNDCDGDTDEDVLNTYHKDKDGDGYGSMLEADIVEACHPSPGEVVDSSDCDDNDHWSNPGLPELCADWGEGEGDQEDNNCNGVVDEGCVVECTLGDTRSCNADEYGICATGTQTCEDIEGVIEWGNCMQDNEQTEGEICGNGLDDDCDGNIDDGCDTEFETLVDVTTNPILVCFQANQPLNAVPSITLMQGNGSLGGALYNPCPGSENPTYCDYYTQATDELGNVVEPDDIKVQVVENNPVGATAGSAAVEFGAGNDDSDHTNASSYCTDSDLIGAMRNFLQCDSDHDGDVCQVDMSGADLSGGTPGECNPVEIAEVDEAGFVGTINGTFVTSIVDISCDAYVPGSLITITLSFELPAGWSRGEFEANLVVRYWDGTSWSTAGISNPPTVDWDAMTITFTTTHLTQFAASSKQNTPSSSSNGDDDDDDNGSQGIFGGCSLTAGNSNISTSSAMANTLIFLLPFIVFGIIRRRREDCKKNKSCK